MIKNENTRITITLPKKTLKKLKNEAEYDGRSVSNLVLKIINEHYKIKNDK